MPLLTDEERLARRREKDRLRKRKQRARQKAEQEFKEERGLDDNPMQDFMPSQPKGVNRREHPEEYCSRCGRHRFYCECKPDDDESS